VSSKDWEAQTVYKLHAVIGELKCLNFGLGSFLSVVSNDLIEFWV
jgi:hypothetical protein